MNTFFYLGNQYNQCNACADYKHRLMAIFPSHEAKYFYFRVMAIFAFIRKLCGPWISNVIFLSKYLLQCRT